MPELSDEIKGDRLETDTTEAGMNEILGEDQITQERIEADLAQDAMKRERELRKLAGMLNEGLVMHSLHFMGLCCQPATGQLVAVHFFCVDRNKDIWVRPGEDFDFVFNRLWRVPSDNEIAEVVEEAVVLDCSYRGFQLDDGHVLYDESQTKSIFIVEPSRPVFDALMECRGLNSG